MLRGIVSSSFGKKCIVSAMLLSLTAACSEMPEQGPTVGEINTNHGFNDDYTVVKLKPPVLQLLSQVKSASFVSAFGNGQPATPKVINQGDIVQVTIWESVGSISIGTVQSNAPAPAAGSASAVGIQMTTVPPQTVDPLGNITVPFAGQIKAAGRSTAAVQAEIVRRLSGVSITPQALVTIVTDQSDLVTVVGDVKTPNQFVLNINGMRILDAIARAGGSAAPAYDTLVRLTRHGVSTQVRMSWLLSHPDENVYLQPDDVIYVLHDPKFLTVLGATKNNIRMEFDAEKLTLAEVIGQSGGLVDAQAEPRGVYVFRMEPRNLVEIMTAGQPAKSSDTTLVPVIFQDNMREPQGFFFAQSFPMHDKDIVYVANTESVELSKLFNLMLQAASIVAIGKGTTSVSTSATAP